MVLGESGERTRGERTSNYILSVFPFTGYLEYYTNLCSANENERIKFVCYSSSVYMF